MIGRRHLMTATLFASLCTVIIMPAADGTTTNENWITTLGARSAEGAPADQSAQRPSLSHDGRYLAFVSLATNLVPDDGGQCRGMDGISCADVFLRDLETGAIRIVSRDWKGAPDNLDVGDMALSGDGTAIAFWARRDGGVQDDANGYQDYYAWQGDGEPLQLVTRAFDGPPHRGGYDKTCPAFCGSPSMSLDGRYVAFVSWAHDLVADDKNNWQDVFRRDLTSGQTVRVSVTAAGQEATGPSYVNGHQAISADGRFVVFASAAPNLTPGEAPVCEAAPQEEPSFCTQIYRKDMQSGELMLLSRNTNGDVGNGNSNRASLSASGQIVVFQSDATNLIAGDNNGAPDVFIVDLLTDEMEHVTPDPYGRRFASDWTYTPAISGDGNRIAFVSMAKEFHEPGANGKPNVFLFDRETQRTALVSVADRGGWTQGEAGPPAISYDGRTVAWFTTAHDVAADDHNAGTFRLYVSTLRDEGFPSAPANPSGKSPTVHPALAVAAFIVAIVLLRRGGPLERARQRASGDGEPESEGIRVTA